MARRRALAVPLTGAASALTACWRSSADGPTQQPAAKTGNVVTVDVYWGAPASDPLLAFLRGPGSQLFEQRQATVRLNVMPPSEGPQLRSLFAAGTPPDVLQHGVEVTASFAAQRWLQDVDALAARDRSVDVQDLAPNMWEAAEFQGVHWTIPRSGGPQVLYFNRDLFQALGIAPPTERWTWEDWRQAAIKLSKPAAETSTDSSAKVGSPGVAPAATGESLVPGRWGTSPVSWLTAVCAHGADVLSQDLSTCVLDGAVPADAIQFLQDLVHRDRVADPKLVNDPLLLARGQVAMTAGYFAATSLPGFMQPWTDVALFPKGAATGRFDLVGYAIALSAFGTRTDAAWAAAKWLTGPEFQKAHLKAGIVNVPVRRSVQRSEEYLSGAVPRSWKETFVRAQADLRRAPPTPKWTDVTAILHPALTAAIADGRPTMRTKVAELIPVVNAVLRAS